MEPIDSVPETGTLKEYIVNVANTWDKDKLYEVLRRYSPQQAWEAGVEWANSNNEESLCQGECE